MEIKIFYLYMKHNTMEKKKMQDLGLLSIYL